MRWIVLASLPVDSVMRFAALPVGAHRRTFLFIASNILIIDSIIVVLPVPGPPVITVTPFNIDCTTASFCICVREMSFSSIEVK